MWVFFFVSKQATQKTNPLRSTWGEKTNLRLVHIIILHRTECHEYTTQTCLCIAYPNARQVAGTNELRSINWQIRTCSLLSRNYEETSTRINTAPVMEQQESSWQKQTCVSLGWTHTAGDITFSCHIKLPKLSAHFITSVCCTKIACVGLYLSLKLAFCLQCFKFSLNAQKRIAIAKKTSCNTGPNVGKTRNLSRDLAFLLWSQPS